jgi:2-hydroxy-6-oxonona-2,4-dienedioate hydrolase
MDPKMSPFLSTCMALFLALVFSMPTLANADAPTEKTAVVFGAKIRYIEAGDPKKPTVILLHGLGGNADNWIFNLPALAANHHVIALDQVGFGKSDKPLIKYRVATYVDFLERFMDELKIEKAHLVGNSMGGWIASLFAITYPDKVGKIVLANSAGLVPDSINPDEIEQLNNSTRAEIRENMKRIFALDIWRNNEALVDQFLTLRVTTGDGYTISSIVDSIRRKEDFLNNRLGEIKVPTLIIWGKQDGLLPFSDAETFKNGIAGSKLVVLDPCGHTPQFERPLEFNQEVIQFLGEK